MRFRRSLGVLIAAGIALSTTNAVASVDSAKGLMAEGELQQALASLEAVGGEDVEVRFLRGVVLAELDRDREAEQMFRNLIDEYPDYPEPYNNLAVLLAKAGRYDEAVETLKSALRTHPSYRTAWDNLTTVYGRLASEAYSRALNVDAREAKAPVQLAMLGTLSDSQQETMTPVETIPVAAMPTVAESESAAESELAAVAAEQQAPAEPMIAETVATEAPAEAIDEAGMAAVDEVAADEMAEVEEVDAETSDLADAKPSPAELTSLIEAWAEAWSEQRVDDYLSFYSSSFTPGDEMVLSEWKSLRSSRIESPEFIRVAVALLDYDIDGEDASVTFNQSYESNTFNDLVTKTLVLAREDGGWKIVREMLTP